MTIRVISGSAKGRKLKVVPGDTTRPIMDRIKENLFNLISGEYIEDQRWLDVFAGTGGVGIEALSRGAAHCTFVDSSKVAIQTVRENLEATKLSELATLRHGDAFQVLSSSAEPFDLVYIAPPQYQGLWVGAMTALDLNIDGLLKPDGIAIVQIDPRESTELNLTNLQEYKNRTYGKTQLIFYERP